MAIPVLSALAGVVIAFFRQESPLMGALLGGFWGPIGLAMLFVVRRDRSRHWIQRRPDPDLPATPAPTRFS